LIVCLPWPFSVWRPRICGRQLAALKHYLHLEVAKWKEVGKKLKPD
jgi:hypothetical protein